MCMYSFCIGGLTRGWRIKWREGGCPFFSESHRNEVNAATVHLNQAKCIDESRWRCCPNEYVVKYGNFVCRVTRKVWYKAKYGSCVCRVTRKVWYKAKNGSCVCRVTWKVWYKAKYGSCVCRVTRKVCFILHGNPNVFYIGHVTPQVCIGHVTPKSVLYNEYVVFCVGGSNVPPVVHWPFSTIFRVTWPI